MWSCMTYASHIAHILLCVEKFELASARWTCLYDWQVFYFFAPRKVNKILLNHNTILKDYTV